MRLDTPGCTGSEVLIIAGQLCAEPYTTGSPDWPDNVARCLMFEDHETIGLNHTSANGTCW